MKTVLLPLLFFLLLMVALSIESYAQSENYRFERITEEQGLSDNLVQCILQDQDGFMWIGTNDGLNRYDGYDFTTLRYDPNNPKQSLRHNSISDILEDSEGRLWVTTYGGGFHQIDKLSGKVTRYEIKPLSSFEWNYLTTIYEDHKANLWVCGFGGLALFNPISEEFTVYSAPGNPTSGKSSAVFSVAIDSKNRFWVGTTSGLYQFDQASGKFKYTPIDSNIVQQDFWCNYLYLDSNHILWIGTDIGVLGRKGEGLFCMDTKAESLKFERYNPRNSISKKIQWNGIYEDSRGMLWVWGSEGLHRINNRTYQALNFEYDPVNPTSLSHENINVVFQDSWDTYWIGSQNGIDKLKPSNHVFHTYQRIPANALAVHDENEVSTLWEDHTGTVWIGNSGSALHGNPRGGLYQLDLQTKKIVNFPPDTPEKGGLADSQVFTFFEDREQRFWVGTATALNLLDRNNNTFIHFPCDIPIWSIDQDIEGSIWISGKTGMASFDPNQKKFTYYKYNPEDTTGIRHLFVNQVLASQSGDVWAATGSGISRLNPRTKLFIHYHSSSEPSPDSLNSKSIQSLYEDDEGIIWIGTGMGGLNRLDPNTNIFSHFTMREGLISNTVLSIVEDKSGNLWLGTPKGVSRFNPVNNVFQSFDAADGLPSNYVHTSFLSRNGNIMLGSLNGFVIFDPDSIRDNTTVPPIYITGFEVMEEEQGVPTEAIELPYDQNFLSFEFVAINYQAPEKNAYAYRMEGLDDGWVYSGTRRFASYTNLDPGEYTFHAKASHNQGPWNEAASAIQLTILPPWWRTWWAYALYGLLVIGAILTLRHYEMKRFKLWQRAKALSDLDALKSRFFANISHEFRTPLTLILGPTNRLLTKDPHKEDQPYLFSIQRNAQRLLHLVNQLLDLAKLDVDKLKLEAIKTDVIAFLRVRAKAFSSLAEQKQIHFAINLPDEKIGLYFDPDKLEKIINNLLSNAFKFTESGGAVTLRAQTINREGKEWIQIQVSDTGPGIPDEDIPLIFDRFYQVDHPEHQGSGIGLALTRELAELHHGTIQVASSPGQGTTFTLLLPVGKAHLTEEEIIQELPLPEESTTDKANLHPTELLSYSSENDSGSKAVDQNTELPVILIVEDHPEVRAFIRDFIGDLYQVAEAENGKEGVKIAKEILPDLIISDVMMPKMDGYQLCKQLKSHQLTSHIPIILLTAKADRSSKLSGLEIGADDYLSKPFDQEELRLLVRNRIAERQKMREHFSRQITLEPTSVKISSLDEQFLQRVMQVVEDHIADTAFGVEAFSEEVGMSRMQLYRKLKALTDQSPGDFIRRIRLQRAADLLSQGAGNIADVAYRVGFQDPSYFTKAFQKEYGANPFGFCDYPNFLINR